MDGDLGVASVPDGGSALVLVLPGPADVTPDVVASTLARSIAGEDQRLEERLVRRALAAGPGALPVDASNGSRSAVHRSGPGGLRGLPTLRPEKPFPA
jgi:hypothetical protein